MIGRGLSSCTKFSENLRTFCRQPACPRSSGELLLERREVEEEVLRLANTGGVPSIRERGSTERTSIPYPIFLVVGGLAFGLIPGMPTIELDPDMVFLLFLPPILFSAAYTTSWRDFRHSLRPIGLLAIGCVFFTTLAVAIVAHAVIDGLNWPAAFVLGAIVAPPDAVATTAIFARIGVPRRMVTVLEGESLVNDASALVAYRFAVAAVVGGSFSIWSAGGRFVVLAVGGVLLGLIAGRVLSIIIPALGESGVPIMASLIAPSAI